MINNTPIYRTWIIRFSKKLVYCVGILALLLSEESDKVGVG